MKDGMAALRQVALADSDISAMVDDRVFVGALSKAAADAEAALGGTRAPRPILVLEHGGGPANLDLLPVDTWSIVVTCYAQTFRKADELRRAVWQRFRHLIRERFADVLIHRINPESGALSRREGEIVWPAYSQIFSVLADVDE